MSQITEQIWIGSYENSIDTRFLDERKITHILCCGAELECPPIQMFPFRNNYIWQKIPIVDDATDTITKSYLMEGAKKIQEWVSSGHRIMIHCSAGISRSVSVALTYYIVYEGWSLNLGLTHIKIRRPFINPHINFFPILREIESKRLPLEQQGLAGLPLHLPRLNHQYLQ